MLQHHYNSIAVQRRNLSKWRYNTKNKCQGTAVLRYNKGLFHHRNKQHHHECPQALCIAAVHRCIATEQMGVVKRTQIRNQIAAYCATVLLHGCISAQQRGGAQLLSKSKKQRRREKTEHPIQAIVGRSVAQEGPRPRNKKRPEVIPH